MKRVSLKNQGAARQTQWAVDRNMEQDNFEIKIPD